MRIRHLVAGIAVIAGVGLIAGPAYGAPTGSKNAFVGMAQCGDHAYKFVVNSANGQGQGAQNNGQSQGEWVPAHLIGTTMVFHPTAFDTTFTITFPDGTSQSFTDTSSRPNKIGNVTCDVSGSQSDGQGGMFTLSGSVTGWIS